MTDQTKAKEITVNTPAQLNISSYSQAVRVIVTDEDVNLIFIQIQPETYIGPQGIGTVVAKVTLPRSVAQNLSKDIAKTIEDHDSKKAKK